MAGVAAAFFEVEAEFDGEDNDDSGESEASDREFIDSDEEAGDGRELHLALDAQRDFATLPQAMRSVDDDDDSSSGESSGDDCSCASGTTSRRKVCRDTIFAITTCVGVADCWLTINQSIND